LSYGLTRSVSGIGLSGWGVAISGVKRSAVPSKVHAPSRHREGFLIGFPSRMRNAFVVASRSAR
jgi:hypothetical protein